MKKLSLTTAILLLSSMWVLAQSSGQPTTQDQYGGAQSQQPDKSKQATSEKGEQTVEGCLSGAAHEYVLTDATGKTYQLLDDTRQLNDNVVGHQVRLWGSLSTEGGGERTSATGPLRIFGVKKVQSLSDKCK